MCSILSCILLSLTNVTATQTLGEEYTDIWQYSSYSQLTPPSSRVRVCLILLPSLSAYVLSRWGSSSSLVECYPSLRKLLKTLPVGLEVFSEINLAIFYLRGTYYDLVKRSLGIRHVRSILQKNQDDSHPSNCVSYLQSQKIHIRDRHHMPYLESCLWPDSYIVQSQ